MGVIMTETEFAMVSEWMSNGNINQFVKERPEANRFPLVSFPEISFNRQSLTTELIHS